ncbi:MAG: N-6 DNA methylase [Pseudomonadota bacterium]
MLNQIPLAFIESTAWPTRTSARAVLTALGLHGWNVRDLGPRLVPALVEGSSAGHFDILTEQGGPFMFACAHSGTGRLRAEAELAQRLEESDVASVAMLTDGTAAGTRFWQRLRSSNRIRPIEKVDPWAAPARDLPLLEASTSGGGGAQAVDGRFETTLFETHSHMRDVDGLHAPEAIDEICKLLFLKVFDERTTSPGKPLRMQRAAYGSLDEYATAARSLFVQAIQAEAQRLAGAGHETEKIWTSLVLSNTALARCLDELAPFSLDGSPLDLKGRAFQNVLRPAARAGMGQYFTPEAVGEMMIATLNPGERDRLLDPFAGSAHFLALCARHVSRSNPGLDLEAYCQRSLFGIEKSERMLRIAWTDLMLHHLNAIRLVHGDALGSTAQFPSHALDSFDGVVTNPPFGSVLRADAIAQLGDYRVARGRASAPMEILAFERAARFLRPGGRLAIVLPDGVLGNQRAAAARKTMGSILAIRAIVSLPVETFSPFGANVNTSVVFARRLLPGERQAHPAEVFLGRVDSVGYDASGKATEANELPAMTKALIAFFAEEGW